MKPRPRARFLCYSRDFDTYSIQILFFFLFFASRGAPVDCAVLAENKLRVLLVFSEMLLEYHTGHIRMVNLNRSDAARLKKGECSYARTPRWISQPRTRTNREQRRSRPPISLPPSPSPTTLRLSLPRCAPLSPVSIRDPDRVRTELIQPSRCQTRGVLAAVTQEEQSFHYPAFPYPTLGPFFTGIPLRNHPSAL